MKKRLIFLLAALALTGCAAPAETAVDSLPAAAPVGAPLRPRHHDGRADTGGNL